MTTCGHGNNAALHLALLACRLLRSGKGGETWLNGVQAACESSGVTLQCPFHLDSATLAVSNMCLLSWADTDFIVLVRCVNYT